MTDFKQVEKIIVNLARSSKEWNKAHDLIGYGTPTFIGYEASARLTDAQNRWPEAIESRQDGRFKERRLKVETSHEWLPLLPKHVAKRVEKIWQARGVTYTKLETIVERTNENTVRKVNKIVTYEN